MFEIIATQQLLVNVSQRHLLTIYSILPIVTAAEVSSIEALLELSAVAVLKQARAHMIPLDFVAIEIYETFHRVLTKAMMLTLSLLMTLKIMTWLLMIVQNPLR